MRFIPLIFVLGILSSTQSVEASHLRNLISKCREILLGGRESSKAPQPSVQKQPLQLTDTVPQLTPQLDPLQAQANLIEGWILKGDQNISPALRRMYETIVERIRTKAWTLRTFPNGNLLVEPMNVIVNPQTLEKIFPLLLVLEKIENRQTRKDLVARLTRLFNTKSVDQVSLAQWINQIASYRLNEGEEKLIRYLEELSALVGILDLYELNAQRHWIQLAVEQPLEMNEQMYASFDFILLEEGPNSVNSKSNSMGIAFFEVKQGASFKDFSNIAGLIRQARDKLYRDRPLISSRTNQPVMTDFLHTSGHKVMVIQLPWPKTSAKWKKGAHHFELNPDNAQIQTQILKPNGQNSAVVNEPYFYKVFDAIGNVSGFSDFDAFIFQDLKGRNIHLIYKSDAPPDSSNQRLWAHLSLLEYPQVRLKVANQEDDRSGSMSVGNPIFLPW